MNKEQVRAREVLDDLLKIESGLNPKELDFIEDMDGKRDRIWTEKQIQWLDDITYRFSNPQVGYW